MASKLAARVALAVPLSERPLTYSSTLRELVSWRRAAREQALGIGSKLLEADGGPGCEELARELDWYLEDAVEGWNGLNRSLVDAADTRVRLRQPIQELDRGWRERIQMRRPFQYLVASAHWRDLVLSVQEGVLIPRPETEQLVDLAACAMAKYDYLSTGLWADLGTGSGAIAIAIAQLLRKSGGTGRVVAIDSSDVPIAVAKFNASRCQVEDIVSVVQGSWFSPFEKEEPGKLSGVVSNPPYIPSKNIQGLQAEVGRHEPHCALDGGEDGMDQLRLICDGASCALRPGGFLALETNGGKQAEAVADKLSSSRSFKQITLVKDLAGIDRFVTAHRR